MKRTDMADAFVTQFGQDEFDRICEAAWNQKSEDGIEFLDHHMINAANWRHHGIYTAADGEEYLFDMECGDIVGCDFKYGLDLELKAPEQTRKRLRIADRVLRDPAKAETARTIFQLWQKEPWFKELEGKYTYDALFAPGSKTDQHYRELADKRGMSWETEVLN